jgi:hypothetical protein
VGELLDLRTFGGRCFEMMLAELVESAMTCGTEGVDRR